MTTAPPPGGGEPHPSGAIDLALWERTIAGMATPAEQARVSAWVTAVAGHPPVANLLRTAVHQLEIQAGAPDLDVSSSLQRVHARIEAVTIQPRPPRPATDHRPWPQEVGGGTGWRKVLLPAGGARAARPQAVAAALLVIALGVSLAIRSASRGALSTSPSREYVTAMGQRLTITLADGTQLTLAPASRVQVAADYGRRTAAREVVLAGEAYFAVAHDAARPFTVHAGNALAEDLGTRFVVRSYPGEPVVRVVVTDGRVSLSDTTRGTAQRPKRQSVLASGTLGEVDRLGVTHVTAGVNADDYVGWTRGELRFVKTPLRDVLAELGRWYDLDVQTNDLALGDRLVAASFASESASDVFTALAAGSGTHWRWIGRSVVFSAGSE